MYEMAGGRGHRKVMVKAIREPGVMSDSPMCQSKWVLEKDVSRNWEDRISGLSRGLTTVVSECGQSSSQKFGNGLKEKNGKHGIVHDREKVGFGQKNNSTLAGWMEGTFEEGNSNKC